MHGFVDTGNGSTRYRPAVWMALLAISIVALADSAETALGRTLSIANPSSSLRLSGKAAEAPARTIACLGKKATPSQKRTATERRMCSKLPKKVVPWSLRADKPSPLTFSGQSDVATQLVTNEAGDELDVTDALPSTPYEEPFNKKCELIVPYRLAFFNPCGYVTFYDANWETSEKAPITNVEGDIEYDACGKGVEGGITEGWHVIGTEYTLYGWHAGHKGFIPGTVGDSCMGIWTLLYIWAQKFSDSETLVAEIEVPFLVTAVPSLARQTWGGGNPAELPCSQECHGDPVNTATGDYNETTTDLSIPGRGPNLAMTRTYSSLAARSGMSSALGRGWTFNYNMSLSIDPETGDATVTNANGSETTVEAGPEGFTAAPHMLATLVEEEGETYTYTVRQRMVYTFDSSGKLIGVADLNGNETTLAYDESGRLESAEDDAGRTLTFAYYEESDELSDVSDSTGRDITYDYDESGNLEQVMDVRGGHTKFSYDEIGLLLTREDAREILVLTNTYDKGGRIKSQTDGLEDTTTFVYGGTEPFTTTWVTDPRGILYRYDYEEGALVEKREASNTGEKAVWSYERDPATLGITSVTDPNGHTSHATYDSFGNRTSTEDAIGNTTESAYDSLGDLIEYTDANGVTTSYEYDEHGNLLTTATPLEGSEPEEGRVFTYAYEDEEHRGDITAITDPNGESTQFAYDSAGNLESMTDAEGDETTYAYDEHGDRLTQVSPRGNAEEAELTEFTTTFSYDKAGNRLSATDSLEHERSWTYDADGNLESETDANGHTTSYVYNAASELISVERPNGQAEATTYDANGNVEAQIDGLEHETTYTYDALNRLKTSTDPLGRSTEYRYDQAGNLRLTFDPKERATSYVYDDANVLEEVEYEDEATPNIEYEYDPDGHRVSMSDGTGESSYEYDSLGRLTSATDGHGDATAYRYDLAGNVTGVTYPNSKTVTRTFDKAGRLTNVDDWLGHTTTFSYDRDSNPQDTSFPEGTGNVDEYVYNHADRMSGVAMKRGSETLASLSYVRDDAGQVESVEMEGLPDAEEEGFEYDENGRLTQAGSEDFEYDAANNLTEAPGTTNTYDAANQLKEATGLVYHYDKLGERTEGGSPAAIYSSSFGSAGSGNGQFQHPAGIAVDSEGNIWVADEEDNRIEEFNEEGEYLSQFGSEGSGEGEFQYPTDVAIDSEGHLWVTDSGNNRIEEFNEEGEYLSQFGSEGEGEGEFAWPESLAIDSHGNIWVADTYNSRLQEFDQEGEFIKVVGEYGDEEGQINEATAIAIGPEDNVWVADYSNFRISEFNEEGEFVRQFGGFGSGDGQFEGPGAIDVDVEGNVWVADEWNPRVQKFNGEGEYVGQFGEGGSGEGQFSFGWRMGLATDSHGNLWIADTENARVQRWQVPAESVPRTTYKYDQAGNLIAVERPEAGESPAIDESYTYDGTGLRASQAVSEVTSYLTWDQSSSLPLLLSDGQTSYIYGPGGLPVEQVSSEGVPTYYHHDQLGSTRMVTNASGEVTGTFSYGAYGSPTGSTGTETTPLGYAGQYTNAESGLQYLRARVYDPKTKQFLTKDPMRNTAGSIYAYAASNPLSHIDPSGLACVSTDGPIPVVSPQGCVEDAANEIGRIIKSPPSVRELAEIYVGFVDGGTAGLTRLARNILGIGNGGLELCGTRYEVAGIVGAAIVSVLLPEVAPKAAAEAAARFPEAATWVETHPDLALQVARAVEEYAKLMLGGK